MKHLLEHAVEELVGQPEARAVARANPEDKFVLWGAETAMCAVARKLNVRDKAETRWFDKMYDKSKFRHGSETSVCHYRNPVIQDVCREAYRRLNSKED
jgi:hypothetical protein